MHRESMQEYRLALEKDKNAARPCLYNRPPFKRDRSEGLPIKNRHFPIENPLVVVESVDFRGFLTYFGIFGPRMK